MAIGLPLPPTTVPKPRLDWRQTGTLFARRAHVIMARSIHIVSATQTLWQRLVKFAQCVPQSRTRTRQRMRTQLVAFEQHYERLVDLLCSAAHEGVRPDRQHEYTQIRTWMRANYPELADRIRVHWQADGPGADPFVPLFRDASLEQTVNIDTGIEDIMRSRTALDAFRASLDGPAA